MTSEDKKRFESQWPAVAARLERMLARRGVPIDRREDIVQETGLRLLGSWDRVDAAKPLWPLTVTIALNLMRDQARKGLDTEVPCELPDRCDDSDVETLGLARLELKRAGLALAQMKQGQRDVLLAEIDPQRTYEKSSPATKMLRMRARRKLTLLMQQVSALAVAPVVTLKRLTRFGHLMPFTRASEGAVTSALCGVLCVVALGGAVSLAPFSALPGSTDDAFKLERVDDDQRVGSAALVGTHLATSFSGGGVSKDDEMAALRKTRTSATYEAARRQTPGEARGAIEQGGSYHVPVGGKPVVHGQYTVQVFGGGHGGTLPTSVDCSEHMVSPDEIDATCWEQGNPDRRYGVRVKHEGKATLSELDISGT